MAVLLLEDSGHYWLVNLVTEDLMPSIIPALLFTMSPFSMLQHTFLLFSPFPPNRTLFVCSSSLAFPLSPAAILCVVMNYMC